VPLPFEPLSDFFEEKKFLAAGGDASSHAPLQFVGRGASGGIPLGKGVGGGCGGVGLGGWGGGGQAAGPGKAPWAAGRGAGPGAGVIGGGVMGGWGAGGAGQGPPPATPPQNTLCGGDAGGGGGVGAEVVGSGGGGMWFEKRERRVKDSLAKEKKNLEKKREELGKGSDSLVKDRDKDRGKIQRPPVQAYTRNKVLYTVSFYIKYARGLTETVTRYSAHLGTRGRSNGRSRLSGRGVGGRRGGGE
jgi:hypothetical protein